MLDEQLAALRAMPVFFTKDGTLPEDAPSARVLATLEALQLIQVVGEGEEQRWALSSEGIRELRRWSPASPYRRWPL